MSRWKGMPPILVGRWQIPLAVCALLAAVAALYRMKPPERPVPFDALLADVLALADSGRYYDAADAAANLLERKPPFARRNRATLHNVLADLIYREELLRGLPDRKNAEHLLEQQEAALACGYPPDEYTALRLGRAHEWLGQTQAAINAYRAVVAPDATADARRTALQGLVRLLEGQPQAEAERRGCIEALLAEEGVSSGYIWWALQHAVREALDCGDVARARDLLTQHAGRLERSDLKGYRDFLWAWVELRDGQTDLALPLADRVQAWLDGQPHTDAEMDQAGFLPAMNRWLYGAIHLAEGRPQAALAGFDEALALQSHGELLVSVTLDQARALALLERHDAARAVLREAIAHLRGDTATLGAGQPRLRRLTEQLAQARDAAADRGNALAYLELALELTPEEALQLALLERLGQEYADAAAAATEAPESRHLHEQSARANERAADLARLDEPRCAALLWVCAQQYDQAGRSADARRLLSRFVEGRPLDPRMPQALLQLGQAYAAVGQLEQAITCYRRLIDAFPLLEEAWRARLLTANCLVALGTEHHAEAQQILLSLLQDDHVAPPAPVFREALFELCDLCYQHGAYADAISRMEDFLAFYPGDRECFRIRFMLADAYRRSARALRNEPGAPEAQRESTSRQRFRRAAELFAEFSAAAAAQPDTDEDQSVYERLALFYRGDCLYALNTPDTLEEALVAYRQAAARYQGEPAALTAQVQIANIYLRRGKRTEAARAVERARWLLANISDTTFAGSADGMDRAAWDRYLTTVRSSSLFKDLLAQAP